MVGMTGLFAAAHPQGAVSLRSTLRRLFFGVLPPAGAAVRTHFSMGSHPTISNHKKTAKRRSFYHWSE